MDLQQKRLVYRRQVLPKERGTNIGYHKRETELEITSENMKLAKVYVTREPKASIARFR